MGKLTAKQVDNITTKGIFEDGDGLRLVVDGAGNRRWVFRFQRAGRRRAMGLGPYPRVSLKAARDAAAECRDQIRRGIDPLEAKKAVQVPDRVALASAVTFRECAQVYIEAHRPSWKNAKHAAQWVSTLETYVHPRIGSCAAPAVDTAAVLGILTPIWRTKPETAARVRNRIELVLDAARALGHREGENPARWRGHLDKLLPPRSKVAPVRHRPAMPFEDVPAFFARLGAQRGSAARALQLTILTACRSGEVLRATWDEFDLQTRTWTIPPTRMKGGKAHRVPLSQAAIDTIRAQIGIDTVWVFPGRRVGRPLSDMAMLKVMRDAGFGHYVPHGFRSSFRDWAAECTGFPHQVCEMALAHAVASDVEAAYRRGDLFEKRRALMDAWAQHVGGAVGATLARVM